MKPALAAVLCTAALDAMGVALTLPVMPALLADTGLPAALGWRFGAFIGAYALMQFLFAPTVGALSDRYGRRPVLLVSLLGQALAYAALAVAPGYAWLLCARALAGVFGASTSVVSAYIADTTPADERAKRFGQLGACMGLGFIVGPLIGGVLGEAGVRLPFVAAGVLAAINAAWIMLTLRREPARNAGATTPLLANPLASLRWARQLHGVAPCLVAFAIVCLVGEVGGTTWVLYGEDRFAWSSTMVGISLACFGVFHALMQGLLAGPLAAWLGERRAVVVSMLSDALAYVLIALAFRGWVAFALMPLFCVGGLASPLLQSMMSATTDETQQGRLQGVLASVGGLVSVVGPVLISSAYFAWRADCPGVVWYAGAALYVVALIAMARWRAAPVQASAAA
jgi:MFS transporter, DHA1 family, tetracycline resistance protein